MPHILKHYRQQESSTNKNEYEAVINDSCSSNHSQDGSLASGHFFIRFCMAGTPFDYKLDDTISEEDFYAIPVINIVIYAFK